ncbi:MAG: hypothetical protein HFF50_04795 [Lawsonibacter sp.]|nr:hypothetical protein [Lawsonibacter sp.]
MTKTYSVLLSALFCLFLGGICTASLLLPKRTFSPLENRYLAKPPALSGEALTSGTFMQEAEDYISDHVAGRDFWVGLKAWSERLSGKRENNGVYFGARDTLLNRVEGPDREKLARDVGYVNTLTENLAVPVYFGLIPTAAQVWADRLPAGAPTADEAALIQEAYTACQASVVDLAGALEAHREEDLFYRTDHHWTSLGAFYGGNALLTAMGLEPLRLEDFPKTTVSTEFYGTTFSASGVRWVPPDQIDTYVPADGVQVTSYFKGEPEPGSLYVDRFLQEKDKYGYFLGGNQPLCVLTNPTVQGPRLLAVRDSYTDSLAPFLTQRFSQIHLFDLRYNLNSVRDYVEEHDIDAVAVLYSFSNFASDRNLFLLGR